MKTFLVAAVAALVLPTRAHAQSPAALPAKMHWCAVNCITLVLYHGHYVAENNPHPEQSINCGLFTVERFTRESVVMHRTDCEPPGTAVLTGKISDSGNAIIDGTINWTSHPCCGTGSRPFQAAWGSEIDSIPGGGVAPQSYNRPAAPAAAQHVGTTSADDLVAKVNAALAASNPQPAKAKAEAAGAGQVQIENVPTLIDECEEVLSRKNCATWKWTGGDYIAIWGDGTAAHITVKQWNRGGVLLQRSDYGADSSTASYQGRWLGDGSISGEGSLQWNGGLLVNVPTNAGVIAQVKWTATSQRATNPPHAPCDVRNPPPATSVDIAKMMSDSRGAGDLVSAACWAYLGALQGNAMAQDAYGYELIIGLGVAKNSQAAYEWVKKAADQGDQNARANLRHMYSMGFGVAPDADKASEIGRDLLARLLARLRTPSGVALTEYVFDAADGCEQDPESARAFRDACAVVSQQANQILRDRAQRARDSGCRAQATTPYPPGSGYHPDGKTGEFSQLDYTLCMDKFPPIRDRY
jgi:TPR repeat protein